MLTITNRPYTFKDTHSLPGPPERSTPHEHTYSVEVEVALLASGWDRFCESGMIVDSADLSALVQRVVESGIAAGWSGHGLWPRPSTAENMILHLRVLVEYELGKLPDVEMVAIRLTKDGFLYSWREPQGKV